jgi:lipopolysaccharide transport system permease protein
VLIQIWMYASPVVYPLSKVPHRWAALYALNPMVGVVEGFRWALLPGYPAPGLWMLPSLGIVALLLGGGLIFFGRAADTFADVV